jgi:putative transposase
VIEEDSHLSRCLAYIDLNMVRAGVVNHPKMWPFSGYNEIQDPPCRYRIIDLNKLAGLLGCTGLQDLQSAHKSWVESSLQTEPEKESRWTQSFAVGSKSYIEEVKKRLGFKARGRSIDGGNGQYQLKEDVSKFGNTSSTEMDHSAEFEVGLSNTYLWQETS